MGPWAACLCLAAAMLLAVGAEEPAQLKPAGICAMDGCNCTVKAHHWVFVKCVFADHQVNIDSSLLCWATCCALGVSVAMFLPEESSSGRLG